MFDPHCASRRAFSAQSPHIRLVFEAIDSQRAITMPGPALSRPARASAMSGREGARLIIAPRRHRASMTWLSAAVMRSMCLRL